MHKSGISAGTKQFVLYQGYRRQLTRTNIDKGPVCMEKHGENVLFNNRNLLGDFYGSFYLNIHASLEFQVPDFILLLSKK